MLQQPASKLQMQKPCASAVFILNKCCTSHPRQIFTIAGTAQEEIIDGSACLKFSTEAPCTRKRPITMQLYFMVFSNPGLFLQWCFRKIEICTDVFTLSSLTTTCKEAKKNCCGCKGTCNTLQPSQPFILCMQFTKKCSFAIFNPSYLRLLSSKCKYLLKKMLLVSTNQFANLAKKQFRHSAIYIHMHSSKTEI